jgi:hypothetical protein
MPAEGHDDAMWSRTCARPAATTDNLPAKLDADEAHADRGETSPRHEPGGDVLDLIGERGVMRISEQVGQLDVTTPRPPVARSRAAHQAA